MSVLSPEVARLLGILVGVIGHPIVLHSGILSACRSDSLCVDEKARRRAKEVAQTMWSEETRRAGPTHLRDPFASRHARDYIDTVNAEAPTAAVLPMRA